MFRNAFINAFLIAIGLAFSSSAQDSGRVTVEKYRFSIVRPENSVNAKRLGAVIEFAGNEKHYGKGAQCFLSTIRPVSMPMEDLESYMTTVKAIEMFNKQLISSMSVSFPDIKSLDKSFIVLNGRPAVQGSFSFTANDLPMKGRYDLMLVKEHSSIFSFTWSAEKRFFARWDKASEASVISLSTLDPPSKQDAD